ncbi:MAG: hypothetical protein HXX17_07080 [Geobacteraceae bacterium]|nr:hypothetical protein [Geobacteraceae bacterium]
MKSVNIKSIVAVLAIICMNGCASTVNFSAQSYKSELDQASTGEFIRSITKKRDVPVYFSLDTNTNKMSIEQIDGRLNLEDFYKENSTDTGKVKDCVLLTKNGNYAFCDNMPDAKKENSLSLFHDNKSLYNPLTAVISTGLCVGILLPIGTVLSILSFDTKYIKDSFPNYYERVYSPERLDDVGTLVDRRLTQYMQNRLTDIYAEKNPNDLEDFYLYYKNHDKSADIRRDMIGLYEERAEKNKSTLDFLKAFDYYDTRNLDLLKKADKYAATDKEHAAVEYAVINKSKNKSAFFSLKPLKNNVNAESVALGGNLYVMNISSKGIKNATGRFNVSLASKPEFPIKYGSYFVDVKAKLTTRYEISSGLVGTKNSADVTEKTVRVKLTRNNSWNIEGEADFGEVVQSGGSAVFGFKVIELKLLDADVSYSIINVQGAGDE